MVKLAWVLDLGTRQRNMAATAAATSTRGICASYTKRQELHMSWLLGHYNDVCMCVTFLSIYFANCW